MKPSLITRLMVTVVALLTVVVALAVGAPPAAAQDVQVTSADPPAAEQGTVNLTVTIKGKGFKKGAQAQWFVTGTANPGGIQVNSTTFVSAGELQANINVADDAFIAKFDVVVYNSNGRSGKGTELFSVVAKGSGNAGGNPNTSAKVTVTFRDDPMDNIQSDGQGSYTDGVDEVTAGIGSSDGKMVFWQGTRDLSFSFTDCLDPDPANCDRPFLSGESLTQVVINVLTPNEDAFIPHGLLGVPVGEERRIVVHMWLYDLSPAWNVCLNSPAIADQIGFCSANLIGTSARVKRTSEGSWEIFATGRDAAGNPGDRAGLVHDVSSGKGRRRAARITEGPYSMPFLMIVTCLNEADCPVLP